MGQRAGHTVQFADRVARPDDSAFRGFFESLAVGAVQISPGGDFLEVNDRYCALTGYERHELLRMRVAELDHPDDRPADQQRWDEFLADPSVGYDVEKRYVRKDGSVISVHATASVIHHDGERPLIAKTVEDITDRILATQTLRESEERLRDALAAKEEFLGLVSHELRTPLTVIVGLADVMARGAMPPHVLRQMASEIRESSEHLAGLLESMLVLARADSDDESSFEPVLVARTLDRVASRHREIYPARRLRVEHRTSNALVEGNQAWIAQVVGNLVSNAEKYSPSDTEIVIVLEREGDEVIVRVLDEGEGISAGDLPHVFDPFFRAAHARAQSGGLGLGLAVCRRLVELHGGRIWAARRDGRGSEFGFALRALDDSDLVAQRHRR